MRTRTLPLALAALCALAAGTATAARPGDTLYIKSRNTRVLKDPSANAAVVVVLQPGTAVTWQGPDAKDRRWQRILVGTKQGVVMTANLSAELPKAEVMGTSSATNAAAAKPSTDASVGAMSRALGAGAIDYARKQSAEVSARQLQRVEAMAKTIGPRQVSEHAKKAGLNPVVGASAGVAEVRR